MKFFKIWYKRNNPNTHISNNREFVSNIKKHKIIENVKIDNTCYGIKNLKLKMNNTFLFYKSIAKCFINVFINSFIKFFGNVLYVLEMFWKCFGKKITKKTNV